VPRRELLTLPENWRAEQGPRNRRTMVEGALSVRPEAMIWSCEDWYSVMDANNPVGRETNKVIQSMSVRIDWMAQFRETEIKLESLILAQSERLRRA
jgi:hypothetical protein